MSRKNQYVVWCEECQEWVEDVLFEYVDLPGRQSIEEVSIRCANDGMELLRGK